MAGRWEKFLARWEAAGLVDQATAGRIRSFEAERAGRAGLRWPVLLAWGLGGVLLAAGALLFVAAHWEALSPDLRLGLVLLMVAAFHVGGALAAERAPLLATVLHAVGTVALGAGIFLAGVIFNLEEHWPGGVMLWALGAWLAWWLLRDWVQMLLAALLTPAWLAGEWMVAMERYRQAWLILNSALLVLAFVYLSAQTRDRDSLLRRALTIIGTAAIVPLVIGVVSSARQTPGEPMPAKEQALGWLLGLGLPLGAAYLLRGREAWMNALAAGWVVVLGLFDIQKKYDQLLLDAWLGLGSAGLIAWGSWDGRYRRVQVGLTGILITILLLLVWAQEYKQVLIYPGCLLASIGVAVWGVRAANRDAVNGGVGGLALTVGFFYFSTVMDRLGRSASLIGVGLLFLVGGWALERARRRLLAAIERSEP